jgi:cation diffusion facilitator CzcD-associated flavoprotein CzcO
MKKSDAIIIGAGPAGLACGASMAALGLNVTVLEKANTVGSVWRRHYDRLQLHTDRNHSGLPGMAMPRTYPTYPSRAQVVEYLESYATHFGIQPAFNTTVLRIGRDGSQWRVDTDQESESAPVVVVATGWADFPYRPSWPGSDTFRGFINAPVIRLAIGPIERFGLRRAAKGPRRMIEEDGRVPLLDVGTMAKIRDCSIKVRGGIDRFMSDGVVFSDQNEQKFDAVILATGFNPDLRKLLPGVNGLLSEDGKPLVAGRATNQPGLYFCGLVASPTGQLREIGLEAKRIAGLAKRHVDIQGKTQPAMIAAPEVVAPKPGVSP